jgi:hypothetical protein
MWHGFHTKFHDDRLIQAKLRLLLQQSERMPCWYNKGEGFLKYAVEMTSDGMIYTPSFIKMIAGVQTLLGGYRHTCTDCNAIS